MNGVAARRQLEKLAALGTVIIAAASTLAFFARDGWFTELFSHFRVQYMLAAVVFAAVFLCLRRRKLTLVALAVALPNVWYAAPYFTPFLMRTSVADPAGRDVAVVSLNLLYRNRHYPEVREYLGKSNADVLVLSELTPEWVSELRPVTGRYPYWMSVDRRSPWGLGVFSKYPLVNARATDLGALGSINVVATVALPGGDVQLVAVHLASPSSPERAALRNRQLERLAMLLGPPPADRAGRTPRLLVGDMNLTPFSPYFGDLLAQTGMEDARRVHGLHGTWPAWVLPLQIPIDHCIADPGTGVVRVDRGPEVGSDHYPLEITLRQPG